MNSKLQHEANAVSLVNKKNRIRRKTKSLPPRPMRVVRSATGIGSTHHARRPVTYRHSIKSLKRGVIEIVPKRPLDSRKSLLLEVPMLPN
jgi:hypothetical protein